MPRKKILIFHPYLAPYRIDFYNRLSQVFDLRVVLYSSRKERATLGFDLAELNKQAKFDYIYYEKGFYFGRHLLSTFYFTELISFTPDIVISHELGINTIASIFFKVRNNYKLFVTIDDSPPIIKNKRKLKLILLEFVVKLANYVLIVHPDVKNYLTNKFGMHQSPKIIYFPIIQDEKVFLKKMFQSADCSLEKIQDRKLFNKTIILFVGRLESVKCPDLLLRVFREINHSGCVLVFVGDGSLRKPLENYVLRNQLMENVMFTGMLTGKDLYSWYNKANIFVLPSKFEPFGAVVNEALIAGCFTIVSDNVGASSLVNEQNGSIFKSENTDELISALKNALKINFRESRSSNRMVFSFDLFFDSFMKLT